jgi:hypothetical protein
MALTGPFQPHWGSGAGFDRPLVSVIRIEPDQPDPTGIEAGWTPITEEIDTMITARIRTTPRLFIAMLGLAALVLGLVATPAVGAAGLRNCTLVTGKQAGHAGCYELVWADGVQYRMTFPNQDFDGATPQPLAPFYVLAPQSDVSQGVPPGFPHDHVVPGIPAGNHGTYSTKFQGFFVLCSAAGMTSGACVPSLTDVGPFAPGPIPFASTVNGGQHLTSTVMIESAAAAGLVTLVNLGPDAVLIGTISGN